MAKMIRLALANLIRLYGWSNSPGLNRGESRSDVPGLADALAACAAPLTSLAASLDGTFLRDGERDVAAPYAEEARVRARQLAQRVPARVRRASERLDSMVGELPSGDVRRFPSAAWESGLDGIGLEELGAALGGRVQGAGSLAMADDEPRGLLRALAHRLLDALLRALDGTPIAKVLE
jgi:hypothetical protein